MDGYRVRQGATATEPVLEVRVSAMRLLARMEDAAEEVDIPSPTAIPGQPRMVDLDGGPLLRDQAELDQAIAIARRLAPDLGGDRVGHHRPISSLDCWIAQGDRTPAAPRLQGLFVCSPTNPLRS